MKKVDFKRLFSRLQTPKEPPKVRGTFSNDYKRNHPNPNQGLIKRAKAMRKKGAKFSEVADMLTKATGTEYTPKMAKEFLQPVMYSPMWNKIYSKRDEE